MRVVRKRAFLMRLFFVIAALCGLAVLIFLMRGTVTTSGDFPGDIKNETVICESATVGYPFFTYDNSTHKTIKISATFSSGSLHALSLIAKYYYSSTTGINDSYNVNNFAVGSKLAENGHSINDLGSNFSKQSDHLKFSLFANGDDITSQDKQFFMLSSSTSLTPKSLVSAYSAQGFSCTAD